MNRMYYSRKHFETLSNGRPDTPETVNERLRNRAACEAAVRDREERFPILTGENAGEAMKYREERIAFHLSQRS